MKTNSQTLMKTFESITPSSIYFFKKIKKNLTAANEDASERMPIISLLVKIKTELTIYDNVKLTSTLK